MTKKRRPVPIVLATATLALLTQTLGADTESQYSPWWDTACEFVHPEEISKGMIQSNGFVSFRRFPVTPESIDQAGRTISPFSHGITFKMDGGSFTTSWRRDHVQISVVALGHHNSAVAMTVVVNGRTIGDGIFGNMDLLCWRPFEDLVEKYSPGSITGSPPRPHFLSLDKNGNVIPD